LGCNFLYLCHFNFLEFALFSENLLHELSIYKILFKRSHEKGSDFHTFYKFKGMEFFVSVEVGIPLLHGTRPHALTCSYDNPKLARTHTPLSWACSQKSWTTRLDDNLATSYASNFLVISSNWILRSLCLASKVSCVSKLRTPCFFWTLVSSLFERYSFNDLLSINFQISLEVLIFMVYLLLMRTREFEFVASDHWWKLRWFPSWESCALNITWLATYISPMNCTKFLHLSV